MKKCFYLITLLGLSGSVYAANLSEAANNIVHAIDGISGLLIALAYVCGLGYAVSAIMKFKNHKDNPQQMPISTPITELFIAIALLFLPTIAKISGMTIFGEESATGRPLKAALQEESSKKSEPVPPPYSRPYVPNQNRQAPPPSSRPKNPSSEEQPQPPYYYVPE